MKKSELLDRIERLEGTLNHLYMRFDAHRMSHYTKRLGLDLMCFDDNTYGIEHQGEALYHGEYTECIDFLKGIEVGTTLIIKE